jgi:hypothetical protein
MTRQRRVIAAARQPRPDQSQRRRTRAEKEWHGQPEAPAACDGQAAAPDLSANGPDGPLIDPSSTRADRGFIPVSDGPSRSDCSQSFLGAFSSVSQSLWVVDVHPGTGFARFGSGGFDVSTHFSAPAKPRRVLAVSVPAGGLLCAGTPFISINVGPQHADGADRARAGSLGAHTNRRPTTAFVCHECR